MGKRGRVAMRSEMRIRFDYGRIVPWVQHIPGSSQLRVIAGPHSLLIDAPVEAEGRVESIVSEFEVEEGQTIPFRLAYGASHLPPPKLSDAQRSLDATEVYWRDWAQRCNFTGEWRDDTDTGIDGLPGDEGAFLACSFWLVDNMILQGRNGEARSLFERLLSLRNDVGLLSEQYDWRRGELVDNFPQAFSHFSLIDTAYNFAGERGMAREGADDRVCAEQRAVCRVCLRAKL